MKIACNTRLFLPGTLEGVARFSYEVIKRMVQNHPEDEFIFIHDRKVDGQFRIGENVMHVSIGPQARHPLLWYWWFEKSTAKVIHKHKPDVYFSPELYCCLTASVPTMTVCHDLAYAHYPEHIPVLERKYLMRFVPRFVQRAQAVGCVSEATRRDLLDKTSIPTEKTLLTPNGATPGFYPLGDLIKQKIRNLHTDGHPYFIYIGSMHPRKNIPNMIRAYDHYRVNNPDTHHRLVLVGRFAWKAEKSKKTIDQATYKEDIIILGERSDAADLVGGADALLYVSLLEGFGIPILEALAAQVPVITSSTSSMPEVVGDAGIVVDPTDIGAISQAMVKITSEVVREKLTAQAESQLEKYSWDKTASIVYNQLKSLTLG